VRTRAAADLATWLTRYLDDLRARRYAASSIKQVQIDGARLVEHLRTHGVRDARAVSEAHLSAPIDPNGNLASDGLTSYTWNVRDDLASLSGAASASFWYDGMGRRRKTTIGSTTTQFLYDGLNLVQQLSSGGTPQANQLTGLRLDETLTRTDAGATVVVLADAQGSTLALTNTIGAVETTYTYEPFGQTQTSGSSSAGTNQFTGRENDGSGLYYFRARYYSPGSARFITEDPLEFGGGSSNLYEYAKSDPLELVDPLGLRPLTACEKERLHPYFPGKDLDNVDLRDGEVPWWLRRDMDAVTIKKHIWTRPGYYDPSTNLGLSKLAHEMEHVEQYGMGMSVLGYLFAGSNGYDNNPFEQVAYSRETSVRRDLDRRTNMNKDKYPACKNP
jgi:RHS repeat-associated protein